MRAAASSIASGKPSSRAQIGLLLLQPIQPGHLIRPAQRGLGALGHGAEIERVRKLRGRRLATLGQALQRVFADSLQHREARLAIRRQLLLNQVFIQQRVQAIEHADR